MSRSPPMNVHCRAVEYPGVSWRVSVIPPVAASNTFGLGATFAEKPRAAIMSVMMRTDVDRSSVVTAGDLPSITPRVLTHATDSALRSLLEVRAVSNFHSTQPIPLSHQPNSTRTINRTMFVYLQHAGSLLACWQRPPNSYIGAVCLEFEILVTLVPAVLLHNSWLDMPLTEDFSVCTHKAETSTSSCRHSRNESNRS